MKILDPDIYTGKKIKICDIHGDVYAGTFYGWDWDYFEDDVEYGNKYNDGQEHMEINWIDEKTGLLFGIVEEEIESIEILGTARR